MAGCASEGLYEDIAIFCYVHVSPVRDEAISGLIHLNPALGRGMRVR